MIGHKDIEKNFIKLVKEKKLSHGYIFYGEPQIGKYLFSKRLANYLENKTFEDPKKILCEALFIEPAANSSSDSGEKSVGIDAVRNLKNFLFQKPQNSEYRIAVINDADLMTDYAKDAILKIAEEPPEYAVIILIAANLESLTKTIISRFQKIYFGNVDRQNIKTLLINEYNIEPSRADKIAEVSFGRPGRAIDLIRNEKFIDIRKKATDFLEYGAKAKDLAGEFADIENRDKIEPFLGELIAELSRDAIGNYNALKSLTHRLVAIREWNTNKRIQLESALYHLKDG